MKWHITEVQSRVGPNHSITVGVNKYSEGFYYVVYSHGRTDSLGSSYKTLFKAKKGALKRIEEMKEIAKEHGYKF